jgi:histidinol-phosphate aminotransferase
MKLCVPDYISAIKPYVSGKPLEALKREYGIEQAIKLASNENPLGPSPLATEAIRQAIGKLNRYPDDAGYELIQSLAEKFNIPPQTIVLGNGSDEIIALLTRAWLRPGDEVVLPQPSFLFYEIAVRSAGAIPVWSPLKSYAVDLKDIIEKIGPATRLIFLNVPHNPTGTVLFKKDFDGLIAAMPPDIVVVLDEAYLEFVRDPHCVRSLDYLNAGNIVVGMRTFSKAYGLAGLRIGYGVMPPVLSDLLNRIRPPFNVNSLAQVAAVAALKDENFLQKTISLVHQELDFMYAALTGLGIEHLPTQANFFIIKIGKPADEICEKLLKQGIIVRSLTAYGYPDCIRVSVGLHEENKRFLEAVESLR